MNYYNENDPKAAAWIRELIAAKLIPAGHVDTRSICDVSAADLAGFTQCHFFAGIAGWPLALALAGVPHTAPLWTGSAPCQPFSQANVGHGEKKGRLDIRHLAPKFVELIAERRPSIVFGEQVAAAIGEGWLDELFDELERHGYACGAVVMQASTFGADHERQRLYWGAHASSPGREGSQLIECFSVCPGASFPVTLNPFVDARNTMDGGFRNLLPRDGLSIGVERSAIKGYGNAIVPQVAAEFICAYLDIA
jgi:DNA (cytosine-5)-methyltransferase 1